jgi:hypothetical protein
MMRMGFKVMAVGLIRLVVKHQSHSLKSIDKWQFHYK